MSLDDALGDGNAALRDSLLRQYQQDAPNFSDDAGVLTERLARKLTPIEASPPVPKVDFSTPAEKPETPEKAPDLAKYGTPVEPEPEPSTDDLSKFGTPVAPPQAPLGITGQVGAAAKGMLRAPLEQAGSSVQGLAALSPSKPVAPEGTALIDQLGNSAAMSASDRAKLMGQFMRTVGDRGLQMDFNAALRRVAQGGDAKAESDQLRTKFAAQNAEAAKPIQEQAKYKTGTAIKQAADVIPMTDQEKASAGGMVGSGVGTAATYLAAGALAGPEAAIALGAAGMGTSTAGATFEAAKAKGASDEDAAKAAGWAAPIGAALGTLPLGTVLRPITAVSAKLGSSGAAILAQHAIEGGAAFASVGEAQEYLLGKVAQQYYDPEKGYTPDAKRIIANLVTGALVGAGVHVAQQIKPSQISSPEDIADFIRRAGEARQRTMAGPPDVEGEVVPDRLGLPGPDTGATPPGGGEPPPRPGPSDTGAAATPPKTDHETLLDAGFSEQEIADMSPRARATRLEEAKAATSESDVANEPDAGKRTAPIVASTADDVVRASSIVAEPTPAQAVAGNYQHGHLELPHLGLDGEHGISIETGVGQIRRGTSPDGTAWEVRMPVAYGRVKGVIGNDGDHLDVFIGPHPTSPHVFMIDQRDPATDKFDEVKIMAGFDHPAGAVLAYRDSFSDSDRSIPHSPRMGAITAITPDQLKDWLANGDTTKRYSQPGPNEKPVASAHSGEATGRGPLTEAPVTSPEVPKVAPADGGMSLERPKSPTAKAANGSSEPMTLMQFIASKGGIEPHPELKALDLAGDHRVQIPGRKGFFGVVRPTGMKLDDMREAAEEAGYLHGEHNKTSTVRDLLDAIDEEFNRGNPKHAEGEEGSRNKRQRKSDQEASDHARQSAVDHHHTEIEADPDYKHLADDVKTRAAEIMADERLPLDDAVEQAAMRMVSEDADYAVTPQLMGDTYGKDVSRAIQAKPAPRNGVVAERQGEGERNAGAKEEAQSHGEHVPDTRAESGQEPTIEKVAIRDPATGRIWASPGVVHPDLIERAAKELGRSEDDLADSFDLGYLTSEGRFVGRKEAAKIGSGKDHEGEGLHAADLSWNKAEIKEGESYLAPEVTAAHHEAIEDVLGPMADKVQPVDIARAAELLAEHPEMPPGIAFQHAVIENAVNQGDLTVAKAEEAYGPEVKEILGSGSEGAHRSEPHADEGRPEPRTERSGTRTQAGVVSGSGQTGEDAEDTGAVDREVNQQPDTGRADTNAERETAGGAEPETAASEGRTEAGVAQTTIPGTEPITDGELAQRKSDQPLKPTAAQQPADDGLFGDGHKQTDLLDLTPAQESDRGISSQLPSRDAGPEPEDVPSLEEGRGAGAVRPVEGERGSQAVSGADEGRAEGTGRPADLASSEGSGGGSEGDDVRVSGRHADTEAGRGERAVQRDANRVRGENYHIEPGALGEDRGPKAKATDNVQAIKLAARVLEEDRPATAAEQHQLARYVGWGGIKGAFPDADGEYAKGFETIGAELKDALTPEEYDTARRSIQYTHYTSEDIINGMWKAAQQLGFEGGSVFEPGMGVGNFPGLMPPDVAERSTYQGIELDHVSARIASLLYPKWGVRRDDFTRMPLPENAFDLAIGNPPFADIAVQADPKYKQGFLLHDYFFAKSLDAVRPGGLLMFVTSAGTMNKIDTAVRDYLADRAELVGAVRLPGNAFKKNAGTEVTTDIIILRKLMPGEAAADRSWTRTTADSLPGPNGTPVIGQVSSYFVRHPEMVLGKADFADKLYLGRYSVKAWDNFDLKDALAVAVAKLPRNVMKSPETPTERAEVDFDHTEKKQGSYYIDKDGSLRQIQSGAGVVVARRGKGVEGGKSAEQIERIRGLIPIRDALRETYAADLNDDKDAGDKARKKLNAAYDGFVGKYGPINKAEIQLRRPSVVQQESARAEAREEARYAGLEFNEGTFDATKMLDANRPMAEIARARKEAREAAATAGLKFDEGSFDPEDMKDNILDKRPNIEPFMDDQEAYRLRAIEHYDDASGKASKGLVFSQNVITRETPPQINSINDAALYVLNQKGRLDLDAIGALADKSKSETIEALGDRIYRVPGTKDTWETKEAYLSGNVRKKLTLAKKEAARDPLLRRNVEALEANQLAPLAPAQIYAGLGMPWIPEKVIEDFAKQELGLTAFRAKYIPVLAQWTVSGDTDSVASITTFGTSRRNATALMSDALNHITPKIYDEVEDGKRVLNVTATQDAQDKLTTIKEKFKGWVFADDARADPLAAYYNEHYNNLVVRQYDGSYLTTPGIASGWKWRPHQTRVISRIIQEGNTYMAHAVGAGKTSAMIGSGMEMRRLGLVKKPMYAIPNHMLAQFTKEFYEQYPTARIAVADDRNFHADRRKQFMANVALDDLDAIIITHTNFGMIPVSDEFADEMIGVELDRYRNALAEMPSGQDSRITRSRIEKQIERLEQRLSGKSNRRRDAVFTFDEMGVDFLFVDEAQEFRKLDFSTQMSNLKGITPEGSGKAWDLYVKTKLLEKRNPGRNLVLASGTPVTNTMAELYTVSRYLQPGKLAERQLSAFDAWAGAFGEEVSELEQDAAGGYKPVARFAKFINVAELSAMVRQVMDVVTSRQLEQYVTRPKIKGGKRSMNLAEKSPALIDYQDGLAARMVAIKNRGGKPKPGDDIMLTVIGDGRHAAIDIRLVGGEVDPDYPTKLELLIDNVFNTMKATARTKFYRPREGGYDMSAPVDVGPATQMIFSNLGISAKRGLPVHDYIRAELVRRGIPRDKIALISEYKTHIAKQKLFNDMNSGKVWLMIGSTAKMGTGVNAQRRLIAIHNLDPLWYPSDDEQRNGRGLRQGNWNPEIEINDYSTKGTYDSTMWGLMEKKARFIQGFFEGDPSMREMDDLGEASQYAQAKAMTTNDPRLMRLTELKQDLERAERRKSAFESERYALKRRQAEARSNLDYYGAREVNIRQDIKQRKDLSGDNFVGTVGKSSYDKRVDFGEALLEQLDKVTTTANIGRHITIGDISGFPLRAHIRQMLTESKGTAGNDLMLKRSGDAETTVHGTSALGIARSIESILSGFDTDLAHAQDRVATAEKFLRDSEGKEKARFQGEPEIEALASQVRDLETQLAKKDEPAPSTEPEAPSEEALAQVMPLTERGSAKSADLERLLTEAVHKMVPNVQIKFHAGRIDHIDQGGWGDVAAKYKGVVGLYRPAKQLIELSMESGNPISTAFHEAYHAIEHLLQTARERTLMAKETPRLRRAIDNGLVGFDKTTIAGMAGYEVRAVAFELYRHQREKFGKAQNLHVGVRRWYHRLTDMTNRIRNGVNGLGFQTAEDIFAKAFEGGFADRTPPLLGTPFPQQDEALASVRNPFNGPLRDSVGEAIDEKLASKKEQFIEGYQNLSRPVQNLEDIVAARLGGDLPDSQAFAQKKRLFPGKQAAEAADFNRNLLDPMIALLKANTINKEEAGDILYALHAPERNREMEKINHPGLYDNDPVRGRRSGMSDETARQILSRYSPALIAQIDARRKAIVDYINNLMVQSGLESSATIAGWNDTYQHYAPLTGWEDAPEEAPPGFSGKFNVRGAEVRHAFGRTSKADNPLANLIDQAYRTIERAKKNEYLQTLDNALHELEPSDLKGFVRFDKGLPKKVIDKRTGLVKTVDDQGFRNDPGAVAFKRGGKVSYMIFENPKLGDAIKRMSADAHGIIGEVIKIQNKLKATWTHYSPEFLLRHFLFRYPIEGTLNSFEQKEGGDHSVGRYITDSTPFLGSASKAIFASNKGTTHADPHIAELQRYWDEMRKAGGAMMFRQMRDTNLVREHMESKLNTLTNSRWSNAKSKWQASVEAMDTVTNALDNALRLAAYASARKQGKTPEQAAIIARDATVDFQQSGRWKNIMSLFAPFSGVAINTGARMTSAVARSRIMRMVFGSSVLAGFLSGMFNYLVGGDDKDGIPFADKIAWWEKSLTFTLMNPFDRDSKDRPQPIHIPMPYNWAFPLMIGQAAAAMAFTKDPHGVRKALGAVLKSGLEALTPFGAEHNWVAQISPELTRPLVHSYTNENWNGIPVHTDPAFQKGPRSESGRKTTGDGWKWAAESLNTATGGDRKHSGALDVFPEDLREVLSYYSGTDTAMRFGRNVAGFVANAAEGNPDKEPSRIPFARVVRGTDYDQSDKSRKFERERQQHHPWE